MPSREIQVSQRVVDMFNRLGERCERSYHDLFVAGGPRARNPILSFAKIYENPHDGEPFMGILNVIESFARPNDGISMQAIGTFVGLESDAKMFLHTFGPSVLYIAGGTRLHEDRYHGVDDPTQFRLYTLDLNKKVTMIPTENIKIVRF